MVDAHGKWGCNNYFFIKKLINKIPNGYRTVNMRLKDNDPM